MTNCEVRLTEDEIVNKYLAEVLFVWNCTEDVMTIALTLLQMLDIVCLCGKVYVMF